MIRRITQVILGLTLIYTGTLHLTTRRQEFQAQVPSWLPLEPNFVVIVSGLVELVLGLALITLWQFRAEVGLATVLFFILIFPGNIWQYLDGIDAFGLNSDRERAIRLLFQPLLILWALWSSEALKKYSWRTHRDRNSKPSNQVCSPR
jgi:uncharacterized membrane protein